MQIVYFGKWYQGIGVGDLDGWKREEGKANPRVRGYQSDHHHGQVGFDLTREPVRKHVEHNRIVHGRNRREKNLSTDSPPRERVVLWGVNTLPLPNYICIITAKWILASIPKCGPRVTLEPKAKNKYSRWGELLSFYTCTQLDASATTGIKKWADIYEERCKICPIEGKERLKTFSD